jgi:hypothetical protein
MWERTMIRDGRSSSAMAAAVASARASRSSESETCWTCQPWASKRLPLSSRSKEIAVVPSMVMRLSS